MSKFNQKRESVVKKTTTHQGGQGYTQRPEAELIGILSTGIQDTFYEKENERTLRLKTVIDQLAKTNKEFVAKALVYARSVHGQRTVTHIGAVNLLAHLSGDELGKRFFSKRNRKVNEGGIIYRIDDMTEILACYFAKNGDNASIPNSIKKGFKTAIENADAYQLAKYQMKGKKVSLVDIVNLVHPKETKIQGIIKVNVDDYLKAIKGTKFEGEIFRSVNKIAEIPTLKALILGILKQFNTVEDKNTKSGQVVAAKVSAGTITKKEADTELNDAKIDNFTELIKTKKIGYLALLRNLRNIINTNKVNLLDEACNLLVNKDFISKSLVWPHQIDLTLEIMLLEFSGRNLQKITNALSIAYEASIPNLDILLPEGRTAIVFDTSGSMDGNWGTHISIKVDGKQKNISSHPIDKASLIAATFAKGICGDVYHFGTSCAKITGWNPNDSINTLKTLFKSKKGQCGHGTYYQHILPKLAQEGGNYDRIVIITDEQGADNFERSYQQYRNQYGTPYVYFINICGYAPTIIKANNKIFRLHGYSSDIYETIPKLEVNINEVIDTINKIKI